MFPAAQRGVNQLLRRAARGPHADAGLRGDGVPARGRRCAAGPPRVLPRPLRSRARGIAARRPRGPRLPHARRSRASAGGAAPACGARRGARSRGARALAQRRSLRAGDGAQRRRLRRLAPRARAAARRAARRDRALGRTGTRRAVPPGFDPRLQRRTCAEAAGTSRFASWPTATRAIRRLLRRPRADGARPARGARRSWRCARMPSARTRASSSCAADCARPTFSSAGGAGGGRRPLPCACASCGARAYVCGEETARPNVIEGRRGGGAAAPALARAALLRAPTARTNVETLVNVPVSPACSGRGLPRARHAGRRHGGDPPRPWLHPAGACRGRSSAHPCVT